MEAGEDTVAGREESMRVQLAGASAAVTAEEAAAGLAAARRDLAEGRGAGYGVGFGYVKNFGSPRGLDGIKLEYALTDGDRVANVHAIISGTRLALLGYQRAEGEPDEQPLEWALVKLQRQAGSIARDHDRYATLLTRHPLHLVECSVACAPRTARPRARSCPTPIRSAARHRAPRARAALPRKRDRAGPP